MNGQILLLIGLCFACKGTQEADMPLCYRLVTDKFCFVNKELFILQVGHKVSMMVQERFGKFLLELGGNNAIIGNMVTFKTLFLVFNLENKSCTPKETLTLHLKRLLILDYNISNT